MQRAVKLSIRVADGGGWGVGTRRVMVNDPENSRNGGVGVDKT